MKELVVIDQYLMVRNLWNELARTYSITESRDRSNVIWRHAFSVACIENTTLTYQRIGEVLKRDHASIIHAVKQHESNYLYDNIYKQRYVELSAELEELMARYQSEIKESISKRIIDINGDKSVERVIGGYEKRIERMKARYDQDTNDLKNQIAIMSRQLNMLTDRNNTLNQELKRVKNLI